MFGLDQILRQVTYYNELCLITQPKGGRVITHIYDNSETYMNFQCQQWRQWEAQAKRVKAGTWSPRSEALGSLDYLKSDMCQKKS